MSGADDLRDLPTAWWCPECLTLPRNIDFTSVDAQMRGSVHEMRFDCECSDRPDWWKTIRERREKWVKVPVLVPGAASDPVRRLAILDAMGLNVSEGRGSQDEEAIWTIGPPDGLDLPGDLDVLVVRPRGESS